MKKGLLKTNQDYAVTKAGLKDMPGFYWELGK
jgi:hypothetical protein